MIRGMYAATAGMMTMLSRVQTISNNLANADTNGFKEDTLRVTTFPQQLMARLFSGGGIASIGGASMGVVNESVSIRLSQASLKSTDSPLDVALQGPGFFSVQTAQGVRYTRDGSFRRDGNNQLVTSQGDLVLSAAGTPITLPLGRVSILADGQVRVASDAQPDVDQPVGQLGVTEFTQPQQLKKLGSNLFEDPNNLAQPNPGTLSTVHQGFLEGSNVDPARSMSDLMVAQRSYESSFKMVQLQDEMTSRAVSEVGRL